MRFIFSFGLITSGRARASILFGHINEIYYALTWSKNSISFELITFCINKLMSIDEKSKLLALGIAIIASVLMTGLTSSISMPNQI
jgi:ribulose kinase